MVNSACVIGIDFGTDSVRSLIVDAHTGEEVATFVHPFTRWKEGRYCNSSGNRFRQHPLDHIEGLEVAVTESLKRAPKGAAGRIRGISVDTTGSTPAPVDGDGTVLGLLPEFADNPNALFVMWKDHTAVGEAGEINDLAHS